MADKNRDRWNALFTAVIFASFAVGVIQALFLIVSAFTAMAYVFAVVMGGSGNQVEGLEWGAALPRLAILGTCAAAFLAAGYGARRTARSAEELV